MGDPMGRPSESPISDEQFKERASQAAVNIEASLEKAEKEALKAEYTEFLQRIETEREDLKAEIAEYWAEHCAEMEPPEGITAPQAQTA